MTDQEFQDYKAGLAEMEIGELENENYTLRNERRYLDKLTDEEVAERICACESEFMRRHQLRLEGQG